MTEKKTHKMGQQERESRIGHSVQERQSISLQGPVD